MEIVLGILISALAGAGIGYFFVSKSGKPIESGADSNKGKTSDDANLPEKEISKQVPVKTEGPSENHQLIREAKNRAKEILLEAKDKALKTVNTAEEEARKIKSQAVEAEKELAVKQAKLDAQKDEIKEKALRAKETRELLEKRREEIDRIYEQQKKKLQDVSSLTRQEAREILLKRFDKELSEEKSKRIRKLEEEIKKVSEEKSQEILLDALMHGTTDYVVEHTTTKVKLPDPDMKGRIIGKDGRNIMHFEKLTGVELDLDSSGGDVIVSCFDPVRREIGKLALERLIKDGRIQPARIEDIVRQTQKDIDHLIQKEGDKLCHKLGVYDLPKELVKTLGRFKYRFSYGQNMTKHTLEVANIGVTLARKLDADVEIVKLGCLLHDIGKVLTETKGSHVDLGVEYLREHGIKEKVLACVKEHHEDSYSSVESAIVSLADHISGARPGARSEDYESFAQRMRDLEDAATSFDGVEKAYAISAGREVRVFVEPEIVDDTSTALLAREIARKIELEQTYPGTVTVTVIRETRKTETAR